MTQQYTRIAKVVDLRSRLRSDVAELELGDSIGQVRLLFQFGFYPGCLAGIRPPVSQHRPAHALAVLVDDEERRKVLAGVSHDPIEQQAQPSRNCLWSDAVGHTLQTGLPVHRRAVDRPGCSQSSIGHGQKVG